MADQPQGRTKVFISYSHEDAAWLRRLRVHLKPLGREPQIEVWDDTMISPGSKWKEKIEQALAATKVAVLLVSADFLASDFIKTDELPSLLRAAESEGATILPVILSVSLFEKTPSLAQFKAVNDPARPLVSLDWHGQEAALRDVSVAVEESFNRSTATTDEQGGVVETARAYGPAAAKGGGLSGKPSWLRRSPFPAGMFLGLLCAAGLAYAGYWIPTRSPGAGLRNTPASVATQNPQSEMGKDVVYLFGSGTVYTYLTESDPDYFGKLKQTENLHVEIMQGPTGTGANVFSHAFDQMGHPILVMASRRLKIDEWSQSEEKPQFVFEAYLGADTLEMLLVTGGKHNIDPSPLGAAKWKTRNISALREAFPDIFTSSKAEDRFNFETLKQATKWITDEQSEPEEQQKKDGIYLGSGGSGTIDVWKKHLGDEVWNTRLGKAWPMEFKFWDIRAPIKMLDLVPSNRIYLGSEILNRDPAATLQNDHIYHGRLTMFDASGPVKRGLYIYGVVKVEDDNEVNRTGEHGYRLPKPVARLLKYVLDSLKGKDVKYISPQCRQHQVDYFNLEPEEGSETGWVKALIGPEKQQRTFRAGDCAEQPKD